MDVIVLLAPTKTSTIGYVKMGEIKYDPGYPSVTPFLKKSRRKMIHLKKQLSPVKFLLAVKGNLTTCENNFKTKQLGTVGILSI